jgi:hypothetical protein
MRRGGSLQYRQAAGAVGRPSVIGGPWLLPVRSLFICLAASLSSKYYGMRW